LLLLLLCGFSFTWKTLGKCPCCPPVATCEKPPSGGILIAKCFVLRRSRCENNTNNLKTTNEQLRLHALREMGVLTLIWEILKPTESIEHL